MSPSEAQTGAKRFDWQLQSWLQGVVGIPILNKVHVQIITNAVSVHNTCIMLSGDMASSMP